MKNQAHLLAEMSQPARPGRPLFLSQPFICLQHQKWRKRSTGSVFCSTTSTLPQPTLLLLSPLKRFHFHLRRKWRTWEEGKIDREYDVVLGTSEGVCVSGSESEDSDWSVGWLEPLGPGLQSDDDADDIFAVVVPCYGHVIHDMVKDSKNNFLSTVGNIPDVIQMQQGEMSRPEDSEG